MDNDYPLAPDKLEIKREMLFDYQLKIANDYNISIGNVEQFSCFFDKEKYILHYKSLKIYIRLRLKIKKVYRVLELDQLKRVLWFMH